MLSEVREKSESFEGFFGGRNIFFKTYAGVPNRPIRHFLKIFCLRLLADIIYLKFQPIGEGKTDKTTWTPRDIDRLSRYKNNATSFRQLWKEHYASNW